MNLDFKDLYIIFQMVMIIILVIAALRSGRSVDKELADRLERMDSPESRARLHEAYQTASQERKLLVTLVSGILSVIAPLTPGIKSDDAAAKLLNNIQSNEPATVTTTTTTTVAPAEPLPSAG